MSHLRTFGCAVYAHIPDRSQRKLDIKAQKFRFVGYTGTTGNYKVWDEVEQRCLVRHDVIFNENDFGTKASTSTEETQEGEFREVLLDTADEQEETAHQEEEHQPQQPRRSSRIRTPTVRYGIDEYADTAYYVNSKELKNQCRSKKLTVVGTPSNGKRLQMLNMPP